MAIRQASRELVILAVTIAGLSRLLDGPTLWAIVALLFAAVLLGTRAVLRIGGLHPPVASFLLPSVAAAASVGVLRLVPLGVAIAPALVVAGVLVDRCLRLEAALASRPTSPNDADRGQLLLAALVVGFLAFVGVAALVPGGLVEPNLPAGARPPPLAEPDLLLLSVVDAAAAGLLGYRLAVLRTASRYDAAWVAMEYAVVVAIGAGILRAIELPRFVGPALLVLVFFLWDAFHATLPSRRRDPRWIWEMGLLTVVGALVVWLNVQARP
jgi:hypothetical protein